MRKPHHVSHYLVLRDLINNVDVRKYSDSLVYLTSRIENIKNDLVNDGLLFDEDAKALSKYSHYKPYVLIQSKDNLDLAKQLLEKFATDKVMEFIEQ